MGIPPNILNQIQNMAIQISNIGIQFVNMGIQLSNMINSDINMVNQNILMENWGMNIPNMMNKNQFIEFMNEFEPLENKNINNPNDIKKERFFNFCFINDDGSKTIICCNNDITIEKLSKLYMNKKGLKNKLFEKGKIYFLLNGNMLTVSDKNKYIKNICSSDHGTQIIYVHETNC